VLFSSREDLTEGRAMPHTTTDQSDLAWRKSRRSTGGNCVELAPLPAGGVAVRDSKRPAGPVLRYTAAEWTAFVAGVKDGEFDGLS
jgi:hypothetical protein